MSFLTHNKWIVVARSVVVKRFPFFYFKFFHLVVLWYLIAQWPIYMGVDFILTPIKVHGCDVLVLFYDSNLFSSAGYFWNYWNLSCSWFYGCCVGSWTSWCTRWFNYKPSSFWSNCLFSITKCGKYLINFKFAFFFLFTLCCML